MRRSYRGLHVTLLGLVSDFDQFGVKLDVLDGDLTPPRIVLSLMVVSQMREVEGRWLCMIDLSLGSLDGGQVLLIRGVIIKYLPKILRICF